MTSYMGPRARLRDLGFVLPTITPPAHSYTPVRVHGDVAYVSGQIPKRDGVVQLRGKVGKDLSPDEAVTAMQLATLNLLAQLENAVGLHRVAGLLKVNVFVATGADYFVQPELANVASDLLLEVFGSAAQHSRTAISVPALPQNAAVEIDAIAALTASAV